MKLTALFLLLSLSLTAKTWYLSPSGNDNQVGDKSTPCYSLNRVWPYTNAGDTVFMRGGTYAYNSEQLLINKNGVTLSNYGNEKPTITKGNITKWVYYSGILVIGDNINIRGLEITGYNQETSDHLYYGLIAENCHNLLIQQVSIHDCGFGLVIGDWSTNYSDNITISCCDFYNNSDPLTSYGNNTPYGGADGLRIGTQSPDANIRVLSCRMWNNSDDGVDLYNCNSNVSFTECWVWRNGYKPDGTVGGNGIGFKLGPSVYGYPGDVKRKLDRCLSAYNRSIGFDQNTAQFRVEMVNCTAWGNARGYMFNYCLDLKLQHISINNLSGGNTFGSAPIGQFSPQSAILNCSFINSGWQCVDNPLFMSSHFDLINTDYTELARPRLGGKGLPIVNCFNLRATSPLIDAGYETKLPFAGQLPDIGCFEFYE